MSEADPVVGELLESAQAAAGSADAALKLAVRIGSEVPLPGSGRTAERWALQSALSAVDLTVGRAVEPHLDALAILAESTRAAEICAAVGADRTSSWGVFAAEGPDGRLEAAETPAGWRLSGVKPWCSLAERLSHALVTAHTQAGRRLYAVALGEPGVRPRAGTWVSRGLAEIPSGPVDFAEVPAEPVGLAGWYLQRAGFAWGGMGVAACWLGGARALGDTLTAAAARRPADQVALMHLGAVDAELFAAEQLLAAAAAAVDAGAADGQNGARWALRVRQVVADAAEDVLRRAGHALGPAPLTQNEEHARRVADLQVYVRQHHAERDLAALGRLVLDRA